jgi:hypothetical protein
MENKVKKRPFEFSDIIKKSFKDLKAAFINILIIKHFDPTKRIRVETNTSGFAITSILF